MAQYHASQWAELSGPLRLASAAPARSAHCIESADLLDIDRCRGILDTLGPRIGSPSRAITASLLGKRVAFLVTGAGLYSLSAFDLGLDLGLENSITDYRHDGQVWQSHMLLKDVSPRGAGGSRHALREWVAQRIFGQHLAPLWRSFHQASGIAPRILWENTAVRVYSLYERRLATLTDPARRRQVLDDFEYLLRTLPAETFGLPDNPLGQYFFEREAVGGATDAAPRHVRYRKTCCLYFKATCPAQYCSTCPLLRRR